MYTTISPSTPETERGRKCGMEAWKEVGGGRKAGREEWYGGRKDARKIKCYDLPCGTLETESHRIISDHFKQQNIPVHTAMLHILSGTLT
jgi:hypothetical protein